MKGPWKFLLGASISGLMLAGYLYEKRAGARDFERLNPPGRKVRVNGHSLYVLAMGEWQLGKPTIVLESGHGDWSMCWRKVQPEVAKFARVVAYDRAGFGWSDSGPQPRTPDRIVAELHTLLERSGEQPPYLLVGHSMGAPLSRMFYRCYPEEVAGFVWVDPAHEHMTQFFSFWRKAFIGFQLLMRLGLALSTFGVIRLLGSRFAVRAYPSTIEQAAQEILAAQFAPPKMFRVLYDETKLLMNDASWPAEPVNLGDLPVISIEVQYSEKASSSYPPAQWAEFRSGWKKMQETSAALTSNMQRIPVESGHVVMLEQPGVVIEAIRKVMEENGWSG